MTMAVQRTQEMLLGSVMLLLLLPEGLQACGRVAVESPVVLLGSAITATCMINRENCTALEEGEIHVLWKLDGDPIPGAQRGSALGMESSVTISSFNRPKGMLSCYAEGRGTPQLVDRVQIRAGYPPSQPRHLICVMNVTEDSLACTWDPGRETYIDTNVTLERFRNRGRCGNLQEKQEDCTPERGHSSCMIPREFLNLYQKVDMWVTAQNALGRAKSESLCVDPMDVVKLDPPTIQRINSIPFHPDCLRLEWTKPVHGSWIDQWFELRYKAEEDAEWDVITNITSPSLQTDYCGFRFAHTYGFQMRCIKQSLRGYWSDWSPPKSFLMPERAPTGRLDVWWKTDPPDSENSMGVQLLWKAMKKEESGGEILGYLVFYMAGQMTDEQTVVCNTTREHCYFQLPGGAKSVSIQAYNAAGYSPATEVSLLIREGLPLSHVRAFPNDHHSLWIEWNASEASVGGYILEWRKISERGGSNFQWKMESSTSTRSLVQENIEPFKLFTISLYPLYKDAVGRPVQTEAYSRQKAPSRSPKLQLKVIGRSQAELVWEPVPIEEQNGFITSYTIFWEDDKGRVFCSAMEASSRSFILKDLEALRTYKVHLMSSTDAGSTNGTILTLKTTTLDDAEMAVLLSVPCVFVVVFSCLLVTIYMKHERLKNQFWPNVPDPANSSSGKWIPEEVQEENKPPSDMRDPVITCDVTILENDVQHKRQEPGKINRCSEHLQNPLKGYSQKHDGNLEGPVSRSGNPRPRSYVNTSETVQYARVIVDGYRGQRAPAPLYLRSESTQPLLGDMTPSPKLYENMWFCGTRSEDTGSPTFQEDAAFHESEDSLIDFPLLQGLRIEGSDDLNDFPGLQTTKPNRK